MSLVVMAVLLILALGVGLLALGLAKRARQLWWILGAMVGAVVLAMGLLAAAVSVDRLEARGNAPAPDVPAQWADEDVVAGMYGVGQGGGRVDLPTVRSAMTVTVAGDLVDVEVEQVFRNPNDEAMSATYVFPLHEDAAVYAMAFEVGDERVVAEIKRRDEAVQTFEAAKAEGKATALTVQHRPNVFSQSVANVPADGVVTVTLRYVHQVKRRDGAYVLHVPTRVGPRYVPDTMGANTLGGQAFGMPQGDLEAGVLTVRGTVAAGLEIHGLASTSHPMRTRRLGGDSVAFEVDGVVPNADLEVSWGLAGKQPGLALTTAYDAALDTTYFSALVEPPQALENQDVTPREVVFLLDCSGSMVGEPLEASKAFMHEALDGLRASDTFRVIRFSDGASSFGAVPLLASPDNVAAGKAYVDGLNSEGGTEMTAGIRQALEQPVEDGRLRLVVFLTDGYIGNDFEVIRLVDELVKEARIYAVGVGSSVNRYLLEEVAAMSRGRAAILTPGVGMVAEARSLAVRIETPVMTGLSLELEGAEVLDMYPRELPDVFAGDSTRVVGRVQGRWEGRAQVRASGGAGLVSVEASSKTRDEDAGLVGRAWARARIAALNRELMKGSAQGNSGAAVIEEITAIGLGWSLVTQWTSFVAVSSRPVEAQAWAEPTIHGTPEPSTWLGGLLAAGFAWRARRKKAGAAG